MENCSYTCPILEAAWDAETDEFINSQGSLIDSLVITNLSIAGFESSHTLAFNEINESVKTGVERCTPLYPTAFELVRALKREDMLSPCSPLVEASLRSRSSLVSLKSDGHVKVSSRSRCSFKKEKHHSTFCHVCSRSSVKTPAMFCTVKGCSKTVCFPCYDKYQQTFNESTQDSFICSHCSGTCLEKSRCKLYLKSNADRKRKRLSREFSSVPKSC